MNAIIRHTAFLACGLLAACGTPKTLDNFDAKAWKDDRLGCKGERAKQFASLIAQKDKLKKLGQNQVMAILGKPDFQDLASRNQRFYIYYYKKGKHCTGAKPDLKQDSVLRLRFHALDGVNDVTY